jgi:hypothetical protein
MKSCFISTLIVFIMVSNFIVRCEVPSVNFNGYIDTYLALDNDKLNPANVQTPRQLTYLNPFKNQLSLNIAQINVEMSYKNVRGVLALQAGDFVNTAFGATKNPFLQQAYAGYNFFDKFWLDAGYFITHIGGESLLPKDNWLSSHSIVTIFEPYFQSGLRASYEGEKLTVQLHLLNANGLYEDNNYNKTFGLLLSYKFTDDLFISYADIIGNEEAGDNVNAKTHMLHNIVAQYNIFKEFNLKGQLDYSTKEKAIFDSLNNKYSNGAFLGISLTAHYQLKSDLSTTFRVAYSDNKDGVYTPIIKGMAITLGCEYKPSENSYLRLEGSMFNMIDDKYQIFTNKEGRSDKSKMEIILNFGLLLRNN